MCQEEDLLRPESIVSCVPALLTAKVVMKCVVKESQWAIKRLSIEEICSVYDIPVGMRKEFKERFKLPFMNELPLNNSSSGDDDNQGSC